MEVTQVDALRRCLFIADFEYSGENIWQLAVTPIHCFVSTKMLNLFVNPGVRPKNSAFPISPLAIASSLTIDKAIEMFFAYIKQHANGRVAYIVSHRGFSGDKPILKSTMQQDNITFPQNVFWIDSMRIAKRVVGYEALSKFKSGACKCLNNCTCKTFSLQNTYNYFCALHNFLPMKPTYWHNAQFDVVALQQVMWCLLGQTFCCVAAPLGVETFKQQMSFSHETQLIANGVVSPTELKRLVDKYGDYDKVLQICGFSEKDRQDLGTIF